jgi:hypothetical protein
MSGAPQFPTPDWYGAQPLRPGGSAHKAGLSLEQRIEALERGALGRPGPGVSDGWISEASTASQGGAAWVQRATYRQIDTAVGRGSGMGTSSVYAPRDGTVVFAATAGSARSLFYINIPDHATAATPSFKAKLRAWVLTEADPTDSTVTATLYRATSIGATGTLSGTSSIGTASVTGVNAATTMYTGESSELTISTSGWYMVGFAHNVNPATTLSYGYSVLAKIRA